MENRSNVTFDINGCSRDYFNLAMKLAVGLGPSDRVASYYVDQEQNRIVLLWCSHDKATTFLTPQNSEQAAEQVWAWLATRKPSKDEPDHDGHNRQGWRLFVDDRWGHVAPFSSYAIVAIEPVWIEYGK